MSDLADFVEKSIIERRLFGAQGKILIAVSGGVDSMVLLNLLHRLSTNYDWKLVAAHFNHQLRGRSSDADERLVREVAKRLSIPFVSGRADVKRFARQHKLSVEMAARKLRHDFLTRTAREKNIWKIALGDHVDDQVEHFFVRLLCGAGGGGLSGAQLVGSSRIDAGVSPCRPV